MAKPRKTWAKVQAGNRNISFADFLRLAEGFGFRLVRVSGSHQLEALVALHALELED